MHECVYDDMPLEETGGDWRRLEDWSISFLVGGGKLGGVLTVAA